jgi:hypothetical protein
VEWAARRSLQLVEVEDRSAIGTLVERQARYVMLVHLPDDHSATAVRDGLLATIKTLPEHLRKSLTWDQGSELAKHAEITLATKMDIYFCDPRSPWQLAVAARIQREHVANDLGRPVLGLLDALVSQMAQLLEVAKKSSGRCARAASFGYRCGMGRHSSRVGQRPSQQHLHLGVDAAELVVGPPDERVVDGRIEAKQDLPALAHV